MLSGLGLLNKHSMLIFGFGLIAGLLLTKERRGMSVYYRVVPEAIEAIGRVLHVNCC